MGRPYEAGLDALTLPDYTGLGVAVSEPGSAKLAYDGVADEVVVSKNTSAFAALGGSGGSVSGGFTVVTPPETVDGSNKVFTVSPAPTGDYFVVADGEPLTITEDYTLVGTTLTIVAGRAAPTQWVKVVVALAVGFTIETPSEAVDGANKAFTFAAAVPIEHLILIDGEVCVNGTDYTVAGATVTVDAARGAPTQWVKLLRSTHSPVIGGIPSSYVEMTTQRTTTSATLADITGVTTTITLRSTAHVLVIMNCEVSASGAAATLGLAINFDGVDHDEVDTHLSAGSTDSGVSAVIHRTTTALAPGTYTVKGRFRRASGAGTPAVDRADFFVMSLEGASAQFSVPLTTKGDLLVFSTIPDRLGVGADGYTIVSDSAQAKGVKWVPSLSAGGSLRTLKETVFAGLGTQSLLNGQTYTLDGCGYTITLAGNGTADIVATGLRLRRGTTSGANSTKAEILPGNVGDFSNVMTEDRFRRGQWAIWSRLASYDFTTTASGNSWGGLGFLCSYPKWGFELRNRARGINGCPNTTTGGVAFDHWLFGVDVNPSSYPGVSTADCLCAYVRSVNEVEVYYGTYSGGWPLLEDMTLMGRVAGASGWIGAATSTFDTSLVDLLFEFGGAASTSSGTAEIILDRWRITVWD